MITNKNSDLKILVVDDDPDLLQITERLLKKENFIVSTAINGRDCNHAIRLDKPDLLLLDVMLPDSSGVDICKTIKSDPELSSIFILLLSGMKSDSENISEGLESGADGYLIKPLKSRELLARVDAAIRIIRAEKALRKSETQLRELNATKDKFFSIIAHDLRSPFNSFLGFTEIMAEELPSLSIDEVQTIAVTMRNSAVNLYSLLENLLKWSQVQQGSISFAPETVQLLTIIDECIATAIESAKIKGIEIIFDINAELEVFADLNMLQTIIRNLVSNAIKFTTRGGKVSLSAYAITNNSVEISISDTGIGMSQAMVGDLFRIDVKTGRKGTEGEPSTGLGLLLCKEFVERHSGNIRVESEVGKGSIFHFTLPYNKNS